MLKIGNRVVSHTTERGIRVTCLRSQLVDGLGGRLAPFNYAQVAQKRDGMVELDHIKLCANQRRDGRLWQTMLCPTPSDTYGLKVPEYPFVVTALLRFVMPEIVNQLS